MYYLIEGVDTCFYIIEENEIKKDKDSELIIGATASFYYRSDESKRRRLYKGTILQISRMYLKLKTSCLFCGIFVTLDITFSQIECRGTRFGGESG